MPIKPVNLSILNRLLPLVAIGTVADCQSILDTANRLLVKAGLQVLAKNQHRIEGLTELLVQTGLWTKMENGYQIGSTDLGFVLSPILNSSGRLSHAKLSISVLLGQKNNTQNEEKLVENTKKLIQTNTDRKQMVKDILEELEIRAEKQKNEPLIWLIGDWSKGIIGLLASRLVNQYNLPVIIISSGNYQNSPENSYNLEKDPEDFEENSNLPKSEILKTFEIKKLENFIKNL